VVCLAQTVLTVRAFPVEQGHGASRRRHGGREYHAVFELGADERHGNQNESEIEIEIEDYETSEMHGRR
jgi:hypothetical protein